jgi:hypothetical protein
MPTWWRCASSCPARPAARWAWRWGCARGLPGALAAWAGVHAALGAGADRLGAGPGPRAGAAAGGRAARAQGGGGGGGGAGGVGHGAQPVRGARHGVTLMACWRLRRAAGARRVGAGGRDAGRGRGLVACCGGAGRPAETLRRRATRRCRYCASRTPVLGCAAAAGGVCRCCWCAAARRRQCHVAPLLAMVDAFYRAGALVFGGGHVVLPLLQAEVVPPRLGVGRCLSGRLWRGAGGAGAAVHLCRLSGRVACRLARWAGWAAWCALVAIFVPSFLLVVGALPFWERLRRRPTRRRRWPG